MKWYPDLPDLPIKKPKQIDDLEQMSRIMLDSMPQVEVQEKIDAIAHALVLMYKKQFPKGSVDDCMNIASIALQATGSAIGGHVGNSLISQNMTASKRACDDLFHHDEDGLT